MKNKLTNKEIQNLILADLFTDNPDYPTDHSLSTEERDKMYSRWKSATNKSDWEYIFEPIEDKNKYDKLVELFKKLDSPEE